jgi:putative copper export protein
MRSSVILGGAAALMVLASGALVASAFIGHAAAINPLLSISSKVAHLAAGAVWLGGLLWLLILDRDREESYSREARRVSNAAGLCALFVLLRNAP